MKALKILTLLAPMAIGAQNVSNASYSSNLYNNASRQTAINVIPLQYNINLANVNRNYTIAATTRVSNQVRKRVNLQHRPNSAAPRPQAPRTQGRRAASQSRPNTGAVQQQAAIVIHPPAVQRNPAQLNNDISINDNFGENNRGGNLFIPVQSDNNIMPQQMVQAPVKNDTPKEVKTEDNNKSISFSEVKLPKIALGGKTSGGRMSVSGSGHAKKHTIKKWLLKQGRKFASKSNGGKKKRIIDACCKWIKS